MNTTLINTTFLCEYYFIILWILLIALPAYTAEAALNEGQNLLDQLSLPVKNAFGQDVSPDNKAHKQHVELILAAIQEKKLRCDELASVRKLKLQQIIQLATCEKEAEQVHKFIHPNLIGFVSSHLR